MGHKASQTGAAPRSRSPLPFWAQLLPLLSPKTVRTQPHVLREPSRPVAGVPEAARPTAAERLIDRGGDCNTTTLVGRLVLQNYGKEKKMNTTLWVCSAVGEWKQLAQG
jgi:hypothetical protein